MKKILIMTIQISLFLSCKKENIEPVLKKDLNSKQVLSFNALVNNKTVVAKTKGPIRPPVICTLFENVPRKDLDAIIKNIVLPQKLDR